MTKYKLKYFLWKEQINTVCVMCMIPYNSLKIAKNRSLWFTPFNAPELEELDPLEKTAVTK